MQKSKHDEKDKNKYRPLRFTERVLAFGW